MPDWLPWIFSQMSNRKMLDFKLCVHGLLCLCLVQWTMKQLFNLFSVPRHLATTMIIASDACDSYPLQTNHLLKLWVVQIQCSRLVHDASLCFLCCWIQKPLLFKRMFLFPCSLFDIGPMGHVSSVSWAAHAGNDNDNAEHHWRSWLQAHCALCTLELETKLHKQLRKDS